MKFLLGAQKLLCCFLLFVTSGCIKYHEIVKSEFPQAEKTEDLTDISYTYTRSVTAYDQFSTLAVFDVLWLAPEVDKAFVDLYSSRRGKDSSAALELLGQRSQQDQVSFYVLADIRGKTHKGLQEKDARWTVCLEDSLGRRLHPESVKNVDLEPEFQAIFGYRFNLFKEAYLVTFSGESVRERFFTNKEPLTMFLSSPEKSVRVSWHSNQPIKKVKTYDACDWF